MNIKIYGTGCPKCKTLAANVAAALADEKIKRYLEGMEIAKTIVVKGRLVNLILKPQK